MADVKITFKGGHSFIVPESAVPNQRKVFAHKIQAIEIVGEHKVPVETVKLPSSTDQIGLAGVKKAKDIISKLDNIADLETYTDGDKRKSVIAAVEKRKEELTNS